MVQCSLLSTTNHMLRSAFFPSPFKEAAIVTADGVGEWATTTIGVGEGKSDSTAARDSLSTFARYALQRVHLLHRLQS